MGTVGVGFMVFTDSSNQRDPNVFAEIKQGLALYAESVHRILQTTPLERPHEPNVGAELRRLLFEPNEFYLQRSADYFVRLALAQQEPRLSVIQIVPQAFPELHKLVLWLHLSVKDTGQKFWLKEEVNYGNAV
jgi:phage baseplate assembly protein W